jgi:hypothetical protein
VASYEWVILIHQQLDREMMKVVGHLVAVVVAVEVTIDAVAV